MAPRRIRAIERSVEVLLDAQGPAARAHAFLREVRDHSGAHAAALCRPVATGAWAPFALAGEAAALPSPAEVAAVAGGLLAPWLYPQRAVLVAHARLALALAGVVEDAEGLDEVQGLLALYAAIAAADPGPAGLEEVPGPWSGSPPEDGEQGEHRDCA